MYNVDISSNVTLYGQEMCFWCGAASAQMSRNGYPNPASRLYYTQTSLWNTIQTYNSTLPQDAGWATDPHGLAGCLQNLANPAIVDWVESANTSRDAVMFFLLYWMNIEHYPSPVLVNQGGHWVVVVGWETDIEPTSGSSPTLQQIHYFDPEPHNVGTDTTMTAAQWYAGPWNGAVIYGGTWLNKYVAIVEPPKPAGKAKVRMVRRTGKKLLTPQAALAAARRAIEERRLGERTKYSLLAEKEAYTHPPLLVRDQPAGSRIKRVPQYYIVPFGVRGEQAERGGPLVRIAVLINAYTGALEEVTAFGRPIRYLTREEALDAVASAMRVERGRLQDAEATLMFQSGDITHIRTYPFWQVKVGRRFLYVDQLGVLYGKLLPSIPGD
jgi:hypothetical protein